MTQKSLGRYKGREKEKKIRFAKNWNNKLDCKFFTTIRKPDKYNYYSMRIGETFNIYHNKKLLFQAVLKDANVLPLEEITPELLVIDTGTMEWRTLFNRFKLENTCLLLLFQRLKK